MEHEKPLRGQSKFSNTNILSVCKIKIQISDKKINKLFYFILPTNFITLFLIHLEIIIVIY